MHHYIHDILCCVYSIHSLHKTAHEHIGRAPFYLVRNAGKIRKRGVIRLRSALN